MKTELRHGTIWLMMITAMLALPHMTGCKTAETAEPGAVELTGAPPAVEATEVMVGRIVQVNRRYSYVIVKCESLPALDQDAVVYHKDKPIAKLHLSGPTRPPFVAADTLDGRPQKEDAVKVIRTRKADASAE